MSPASAIAREGESSEARMNSEPEVNASGPDESGLQEDDV